MKTYGQYCPISRTAELLGDRWTIHIVRDLLTGASRFNELISGNPGLSRALLSRDKRGSVRARPLQPQRLAPRALLVQLSLRLAPHRAPKVRQFLFHAARQRGPLPIVPRILPVSAAQHAGVEFVIHVFGSVVGTASRSRYGRREARASVRVSFPASRPAPAKFGRLAALFPQKSVKRVSKDFDMPTRYGIAYIYASHFRI